MKTAISIIPFFLFNSAIANVDISADIEDNNLLIELSSDEGALQQGGHFQIFIDADNNSSTGYSNGDISGADYLLEDGDIYTHTSNSNNWNWVWVDVIDYYDDEIPFYLDKTVNLSVLSINENSTIKVGVHALNSNWDTVASYHGSTMQEFVFEQDSPSSSNVSSVSVYNQAYQENYATDTISEILNYANNAYVLIDPFNQGISSHVSAIKNNNNQVSGYISVGTLEKWRSDYDPSLADDLSSKEWAEWPGEYYVSKTTSRILNLMKSRIDAMAQWGMDWVEFDNMDWLEDEATQSKYGLEATIQESKAYVNELCAYTHQKGMKCMAKNIVEGFNSFDGVTYESYNDDKNWWDNQNTRNFLAAGKPVIIVHYNENQCDTIYAEYKNTYGSNSISFICEDKNLKKYKHY